jgi:hypothetical protein
MGTEREPPEREVIAEALVKCSEDYAIAKNYKGDQALYTFMGNTPVSLICDLLARKLHEMGYGVTRTLDNPKTRKRKNGK